MKLYVEEPDSAPVRAAASKGLVAVSDIAFVEFHAAVARRRRESRLTAAQSRRLLARFLRDWPDRVRVAVDPGVLARAAALVGTHSLRSLDALQLASALLLAEGAPEPVRFGTSDARLAAAARAEGLGPA